MLIKKRLREKSAKLLIEIFLNVHSLTVDVPSNLNSGSVINAQETLRGKNVPYSSCYLYHR